MPRLNARPLGLALAMVSAGPLAADDNGDEGDDAALGDEDGDSDTAWEVYISLARDLLPRPDWDQVAPWGPFNCRF